MSRIYKWVNFDPSEFLVEDSEPEPDNKAPWRPHLAMMSGAEEPAVPVSTADAATHPDNSQERRLLLEQAQEEAEAVLREARQQIEGWHQEAKEAGWREGYVQGRDAARKELATALSTVKELAGSVLAARDKFLEEVRGELGGLAVAIAEKIIGRELQLHPDTIGDIVAQAITAAGIQGSCRIRINPEDYEILLPHCEPFTDLGKNGYSLQLVSDKQIPRGGCIIEAEGGTVDARLETQLAQIHEAFSEASPG